jgi:hypothetical protein
MNKDEKLSFLMSKKKQKIRATNSKEDQNLQGAAEKRYMLQAKNSLGPFVVRKFTSGDRAKFSFSACTIFSAAP